MKMPVRSRKDVSEDLKKAVLAHVKAGMPYRKISALTGLSIGAIAAIKKVRKNKVFWGVGYVNAPFANLHLVYVCL